jgi:hypothetical protein
MSTLRLAAGLFSLYALAVIANALFYTHWSGDASGLPHALGRCAGIGLLAFGLWQGRRWVWWVGVGVATLLSGLALVHLALGHSLGLFAGRPYPAVDYAFVAVSVFALTGALVALLLPASRAALRAAA